MAICGKSPGIRNGPFLIDEVGRDRPPASTSSGFMGMPAPGISACLSISTIPIPPASPSNSTPRIVSAFVGTRVPAGAARILGYRRHPDIETHLEKRDE